MLGLLFACGFCGTIAAERFVEFFAPLTTDTAALSPDGKHLAYSFRHGDEISILTLAVDAPARAKRVVAVAKDDYAIGYMQADLHNNPARITWLGWPSATRIVAESNLVFLSSRADLRGVIYAFDNNSANARILYSGNDANGPVRIFGLTSGVPGHLLVRADREWCSVDTDNGKARALNESQFNSMVETLKAQHERATRRDERAQARLRDLFPGYNVEILPHFGSSARTLARVSSCADAGSFVVYDPDEAKAWDIVRRAPAVESIRSHRTQTFDLAGEHGERFTGTLVLPLNPRMKKAPSSSGCPNASGIAPVVAIIPRSPRSRAWAWRLQ